MLITSVVLMVIALVAFTLGVCFWHTRHDIITSVGIFGGLMLALSVVPEIVNTRELVGQTGLLGMYGAVLHFLDHWNWAFYYAGAILLLLDLAAAASRRWVVSASLIPTLAPAGTPGTVQWQQIFFLGVLAAVLLLNGTVTAIDAYEDSQKPNVSQAFLDFHENTKGIEGIKTILSNGPVPAVIIFEKETVETDAEQKKWKEEVEKAYLKTLSTGSTEKLVVSKVHAVFIRSLDGRTISDQTVQFSGKIDKPDPTPDEDVVEQGLPIGKRMNAEEAAKWLQKWSGSTLAIPTSTTQSATPSGDYVEPPVPGKFVTIIR